MANPQYRLLFFGNVATMLGFGMMQVVQGVLAFNLTGKNSSVGLVTMSAGIPMLILGPFGGAFSDRFSKRMLLMFAQGAIGSAFFVIGLLTVLGFINIGILAGVTLLLGCVFATLLPARQAWVGELLRGPALANGIALQQLAMNGTRIIGPMAAGGLIALPAVGAGGTYMLMSGFFVAALGLLILMQPTRRREGGPATSIIGDIRQGMTYIWGSTDVRLLVLVFAGVVLSAYTYQQLMPGLLENELGQPASRVGMVFGATAIGGIGLTFYFTQRGVGSHPSAVMFISGIALAGSVAFLAVSPTFVWALGAAALVGAASSGFQMSNQLLLMEKTNPAFLGRVMSLTMTAFGLQMVIGFPAGAFADAAGERVTLVLLAFVCLAVVGVGVLFDRSRRRDTPAAAVAVAD